MEIASNSWALTDRWVGGEGLTEQRVLVPGEWVKHVPGLQMTKKNVQIFKDTIMLLLIVSMLLFSLYSKI